MKRLILYPLALLLAFGFYFLSQEEVLDIETSDLRKVTMKQGVAYDWRTDKPLIGRLIERNGNGQIIAKVSYVDGRLHGATEYFYDNKKLKAQIFYRKGKEEGEWKYFDRDGILAKRIYYEAGRVIDK